MITLHLASSLLYRGISNYATKQSTVTGGLRHCIFFTYCVVLPCIVLPFIGLSYIGLCGALFQSCVLVWCGVVWCGVLCCVESYYFSHTFVCASYHMSCLSATLIHLNEPIKLYARQA